MSADRFVSYAQNAEDVVLARALRPGEQTGFWIDVGASDPVLSSVTAAFSERGWRGINIEPVPADYRKLCKERPHDVNLNVALGAQPGRGELFEGPPENLGCSTMRSELANEYQDRGETFTPIEVSIRTLADVVAEHAPDVVDFLKIDVEGFELEVLKGADFSAFRPRVIVIEATEPNTTVPSHEVWEPMLLEHGYRFAMFDGLNRFYARGDEPDLYAALSVPANVQDDFIPYPWYREASASAHAAASAEAGARRQHDRATIALEEVAVLRKELDAAQRLGAQALADADVARGQAAESRAMVERLQSEVDALRNSRLYRYSAPLRRVYGAIRHRRTSPA